MSTSAPAHRREAATPAEVDDEPSLGELITSAQRDFSQLVKQEIALAIVALPLSFLVARTVWVWLALVASLFFVLTVEFLNTAIERLCNHVTPERHEAIRITKDLASTAVFFALALAGLVWLVAILDRLQVIG